MGGEETNEMTGMAFRIMDKIKNALSERARTEHP